MGGEIVKLVERYGGKIADSYALALQAARNPEKKVIVESAVHFMAESIAILAAPDQSVWITNPKAGCTMEMLAKDHMVLPAAEQLIERYGDDLLVVAYMNTSGRLKALAGRTGARCAPARTRTSSSTGRGGRRRRSCSCPITTSGATRRGSWAWISRAWCSSPTRRSGGS